MSRTPPISQPRTAAAIRITSIEPAPRGSRLIGAAATGQVAILVSARPDCVRASRWRSTIRRAQRVEINMDNTTVACVVHGLGHRHADCWPVSLGVALGLGELGVPITVHTVTNSNLS